MSGANGAAAMAPAEETMTEPAEKKPKARPTVAGILAAATKASPIPIQTTDGEPVPQQPPTLEEENAMLKQRVAQLEAESIALQNVKLNAEVTIRTMAGLIAQMQMLQPAPAQGPGAPIPPSQR